MTPEGATILGLGRYHNLFFNCGHGHMDSTMACSSRIVADLMSGRMPELELQDFTVFGIIAGSPCERRGGLAVAAAGGTVP